ncbi:hypothetical protein ACGFOM_18160 [Streptomyces sp. NPDC048594]|uniref:hypothetical protein n=1 Tax=Streptomyces sp. NPDC048594 TaxID=3365575 RepID=UPI003717FAD1
MNADEETRRMREVMAAVAADEPPAEQVRRLDKALGAATDEWRLRRKRAVQAMKDDGMTLRAIAAEIGVSFARVRQILEEDLDTDGRPAVKD